MVAQLENGYTRIANEILDQMAKVKLNGSQFRILMVVWRYTYGFQRKEYPMSIKFISENTGIHKRQVQRELNALIEANVLQVSKEASFSSPATVAFNKHFDQWCLNGQEASKTTGDGRLVVTPHGKLDVTPHGELVVTPHGKLVVPPLFGGLDRPAIEACFQGPKENIKENFKENIKEMLFYHWNSLGIIVHRSMSPDISKALDRVAAKPEYFITCMNHYSKAYHDTEYELCKYAWSLATFIKREKGYRYFADDGEKWINYQNFIKTRAGPRGRPLYLGEEVEAIEWGFQKN